MKQQKIITTLFIVLFFAACNNSSNQTANNVDTLLLNDTIESNYKTLPDTSLPKVYNNDQFKVVTVERLGTETFKITGQTILKDSILNWAIEDGHNVLETGTNKITMPQKGPHTFNFTISATKQFPNSTLQLILYKEGKNNDSRLYELPIVLY